MPANITLIGMPSAGKSVVGGLLASRLQMSLMDTDMLIESSYGSSLQSIINERGFLKLREIEEEIILAIETTNHVIATGGSAVYSQRAMAHLKSISTVVFLDVSIQTVEERVDNFGERGIACRQGETLATIYKERYPLYIKYADRVFSNNTVLPDEMVELLANEFEQ